MLGEGYTPDDEEDSAVTTVSNVFVYQVREKIMQWQPSHNVFVQKVREKCSDNRLLTCLCIRHGLGVRQVMACASYHGIIHFSLTSHL